MGVEKVAAKITAYDSSIYHIDFRINKGKVFALKNALQQYAGQSEIGKQLYDLFKTAILKDPDLSVCIQDKDKP